ncbi:hypothetical protein NEOLI_004536 [Neolecta irregularis DAH-3]|uniref:Uncharacterized protein n=1 Tax=Neolecta irregularis (strain DAH-3) TaxID=1198029 RepID=A0A1U7LMA7_NEOID|nr:hypothetical protein NEOLI_004536 [Neolecta irregularis DAH-3]|eukprot:OLL23794.1 hypothetical protein NEOLI_004536 [Neolecta irregularis DAH-3]
MIEGSELPWISSSLQDFPKSALGAYTSNVFIGRVVYSTFSNPKNGLRTSENSDSLFFFRELKIRFIRGIDVAILGEELTWVKFGQDTALDMLHAEGEGDGDDCGLSGRQMTGIGSVGKEASKSGRGLFLESRDPGT